MNMSIIWRCVLEVDYFLFQTYSIISLFCVTITLQTSIISSSAKDHLTWFGLCESRLRLLIAGFEFPAIGCSAYPFAKFFTRTVKDSNEDHSIGLKIITSFFIGLEFAVPLDTVVDLKSCIEEFVNIVNSWEDRKTGMDVTIDHVLQKDLPAYVREDNSVDLEKLEIDEESEKK